MLVQDENGKKSSIKNDTLAQLVLLNHMRASLSNMSKLIDI